MKAHWMTDDGQLGAPIPEQTLSANGVLHQALPTNQPAYQEPLDRLKRDRGYIEQDEVALTPDTPNLDQICAKFVDEHYHDEDEVRFVLDGAGIFDIRSDEDQWMRVEVETGDLIVVPARRHHRFFLTDANKIRCVRLFKDASGWVPHYR
jgi:1,2-dihydroxy-3-keto-5-methylthiopentene dioxygenase